MNSNDSIRILHIVQSMEAAGVQTFLMNIYRKIDREKYQFDFLTHYAEKQFYDDEIEQMGGRVYRLTVREDYNPVRYFRDLDRFFKEHPEYKIVHGHMDSMGVFYLGEAKKYGVPCRIAHAHNIIIGGDVTKRLRNLLNRAYKLNATHLFACSEEAGKYMFGKSIFQVVHNPIEINRFSFNPEVRKQVRLELNLKDEVVIGHIGRLSPQKNHRFLLDVFKQITIDAPDATLLLVGQGELEKDIRDKAKKLYLENRIRFLGVRMDVERIYQAMDAFVFPSTFEGLGIVAIEAQAAGLPTICSDRVPELAKATDLFHTLSLESSPEKWAKLVLKEIYKNNRKDKSKELIAAGYDVERVSEELISMYMKFLGV